MFLTLVQWSAYAQVPFQTEWLPQRTLQHFEDAAQVQAILSCENSNQLILNLEELVRSGQLWKLSNGELPGNSLAMSGWRWEAIGNQDQHIVLAIESTRMVAICESKYRGVEISLTEYDFLSQKTTLQQSKAMSAKHLAQKSPELFKIYFRYRGPTRDVFDSRSLPQPAWQTW